MTPSVGEHPLRSHSYSVGIEWTGNLGTGTSAYRDYARNFELSALEHPKVFGSADPAFRGDPGGYNPEEFIVAALSSCHMLWYLHVCALAHITVLSYRDQAGGTMVESADQPGHFTEVVLRPSVMIAPGGSLDETDELISKAIDLHLEAHRLCFIANSVNFPVAIEGSVEAAESTL